VAVLLRVRIETVYRYAREGRIPALRVGGTWRFPEDRLQEWLRNGDAWAGRVRPLRRAKRDPLLAVLGIGSDGSLSRGIDAALYGSRR